MLPLLRGPHHCIGTARAVADLIFQHLDDCSAAHGGSLSSADLKALHARLADSFVSTSLEWIETLHQQCMLASGSSQPSVLERKTALSSLLLSRSHEAARRAFSAQVSRCGSQWLGEFYERLADWIHRHVCVGIDGRLFSACAKLAGRLGANLSMSDLLKDDAVKFLLCECVALLTTRGAADSLAKVLTDEINRSVAQNGADKHADWQAIERPEMSLFMLLLRQEFGLPLNRHDQQDAAVASAPPDPRSDVTWTDTDLSPIPRAG